MTLHDDFPNIGDLALKITSPQDVLYNCIAFAFEDEKRHWWPQSRSYWPIRPHNTNALLAFLELFDREGWTKTDDRRFIEGERKIALYWCNGTPTHAARLMPSGMWASKLGAFHDIVHDIEDLYGPLYGALYAIFRKLA